jgi:hypothetical protein
MDSRKVNNIVPSSSEAVNKNYLAHSVDLNLQTLKGGSTKVDNIVLSNSEAQTEHPIMSTKVKSPVAHARVSALSSKDLDDLGDNYMATFDRN